MPRKYSLFREPWYATQGLFDGIVLSLQLLKFEKVKYRRLLLSLGYWECRM